MSKDLFLEEKQREFANDISEVPETNLFDIDFTTEFKNFVDGVKEGEIDIEKAGLLIYKLEKQINKTKSEIWDSVVKHYDSMYEKAQLKQMGIEIKQSGKYDYSHDEEYQILSAKLKKRAEFLKSITSKSIDVNTIIINEDTGEVLKGAIYTPSKKSLTFKKY